MEHWVVVTYSVTNETLSYQAGNYKEAEQWSNIFNSRRTTRSYVWSGPPGRKIKDELLAVTNDKPQ